MIDISTKLPSDVSIDSFRTVDPSLADRFPLTEETAALEGKHGFELGAPSLRPVRQIGVVARRYSSATGDQVALFRLNGFSFHQLEQYPEWSQLRSMGLGLWNVYADAARPECLTRVSLRYVNRIEVPLPVELGDYLQAPPAVPPGQTAALEGFFTSVMLAERGLAACALLTQMLEPTAAAGRAFIIMDIQVFKDAVFASDGHEAWSVLDHLHAWKNHIFFSSLTERALEAYR